MIYGLKGGKRVDFGWCDLSDAIQCMACDFLFLSAVPPSVIPSFWRVTIVGGFGQNGSVEKSAG